MLSFYTHTHTQKKSRHRRLLHRIHSIRPRLNSALCSFFFFHPRDYDVIEDERVHVFMVRLSKCRDERERNTQWPRPLQFVDYQKVSQKDAHPSHCYSYYQVFIIYTYIYCLFIIYNIFVVYIIYKHTHKYMHMYIRVHV